jgi:hypothetical protein
MYVDGKVETIFYQHFLADIQVLSWYHETRRDGFYSIAAAVNRMLVH